MTNEEFTEQFSKDLVSKIKKDILSEKICLMADNTYFKGYKFKNVKRFVINMSGMKLITEVKKNETNAEPEDCFE